MSPHSAPDKVVGILGGMGPEATVDLMQRIIAATPASDDADHIRLLVDNNPQVPSRINAIIEQTGESPAPCLQAMAQRLESMGADFLVMPCNTAHYYFHEVQESISIPLINLIKLTTTTVKAEQPRLRKMGLLASSALQITQLYEPWCTLLDITLIYPDDAEQASVMQLIRAIKAGNHTPTMLNDYATIATSLASQGAEAIVIACTELSVIDSQIVMPVPRYDAAQLLAEEVVRRAKPMS